MGEREDRERAYLEGLERCPRRLSAAREAFLRDYPREHVAGDTVHELLSEIDWLRAELAKWQSLEVQGG